MRKCYLLFNREVRYGIKFIPDPDWPDPDLKWFISVPNPDPAKSSGSDRIRIHNTGKNTMGTKREQAKGKGWGERNFCVKENLESVSWYRNWPPMAPQPLEGGGEGADDSPEYVRSCVYRGDYIGGWARRGVSTVDLRTRENPTLPIPKICSK